MIILIRDLKTNIFLFKKIYKTFHKKKRVAPSHNPFSYLPIFFCLDFSCDPNDCVGCHGHHGSEVVLHGVHGHHGSEVVLHGVHGHHGSEVAHHGVHGHLGSEVAHHGVHGHLGSEVAHHHEDDLPSRELGYFASHGRPSIQMPSRREPC